MTRTQCFEVFTLFPEAVEAFSKTGLLGRAVDRGLVEVRATNYRDFATDKHRTVDDTPFGGGAGMVIKPEPVVAAIEDVQNLRGPMFRVLLTPSAPRFDQRAAEQLAAHDRIGLLCGRYEGIDDRVREHFVDVCYSLGDFVLNGGEVAALAIIEAVSRLRDGVLGNPESAQTESFAKTSAGVYLEHPQYTRPRIFRGHEVPAVLLGGDHAAIEAWRRAQSRARTFALRPELREVRPLAGDVHVAIPASVTPSEDWVGMLRRHGVAALVILGGDPSGVMPWIEATQGRVPVVGFASLGQLRRRLRQRHGRTPPTIALARPADAESRTHEQVSTDPATILDATQGDPEVAAAGAIVVAGLDPWGVQASAVYAPKRLCEPGHGDSGAGGAQTQDQTLATASGIEDSSRPLVRTVVDYGLDGLLNPPTARKRGNYDG